LLLAGLGVLAFSFSLPMTKVAVRGLDPMLVSIGRAALASVLAVVVLLATRTPVPARADLARLGVVALGVVVGFPLLTAYALQRTQSLHGSVVVGLLPLATAGLGVVRAGERPSARYWWCSVIGVGAVAWYVVVEGGIELHVADVLLLGAVACAAVGYTEGAILSRQLGGWQVISWALVLGAPASWMVAIVQAARTGVDATPGQWLAFGYTVAFSMFLGFFAWYAGLARAGIARAGQLQLAQPALAMVWGWPLLGERLSLHAAIAAVIVVAAVAVGRRAPIR
jgi:drug/metabolite transporter (DMT)-like permease